MKLVNLLIPYIVHTQVTTSVAPNIPLNPQIYNNISKDTDSVVSSYFCYYRGIPEYTKIHRCINKLSRPAVPTFVVQ